MKSSNLKLIKHTDMRPVHSNGRKANEAYRVREHLTEDEMDKLLAALKANRHGQRDWLIGLLIYRHGLRVSEACDLRWDDINLAKRTIVVRRLKGSDDSTHYLERDELAGLKARHRQASSAYVFVNERTILDAARLQALVIAFKGSVLFPIVATAARTGARRGEILALRVCDLDPIEKTLRIERAVEDTNRHGLRFKDPKTERGKRTIKIDDDLVALLLGQKKSCCACKLAYPTVRP